MKGVQLYFNVIPYSTVRHFYRFCTYAPFYPYMRGIRWQIAKLQSCVPADISFYFSAPEDTFKPFGLNMVKPTSGSQANNVSPKTETVSQMNWNYLYTSVRNLYPTRTLGIASILEISPI